MIAYTIGGLLAWAGIVLSLLYTGSALATTAIGTLIPVLSDTGELRSRMGTYLLAAGAVGEFGPILLLTLILSGSGAIHNALILLGFVGLAVAVALLAVRSSSPALRLFEQTIEKSSQLAVRWIVVLVFALALLAFELGLDLLLGGFAAGLITRQLLQEREVPGFDSKLTGVAFGVFVPFFFVVSGMRLDVAALFSSWGAVAKMFLFFGLFLVVRGTPALLLYRDILNRRERLSLALFVSTQLPLVLAITTVARETGNMHATTAASLRVRRGAVHAHLPDARPQAAGSGPGRGGAEGGRRGVITRRLLLRARSARTAVAVAVILGVATVFALVAQAWLLAALISGADRSRAVFAALLAVVLARCALVWWGELAAARCSAGVKSELRAALLARATAPGATRDPGALTTLATRGIDALDGYFARYLPQVVLAVIAPVGRGGVPDRARLGLGRDRDRDRAADPAVHGARRREHA